MRGLLVIGITVLFVGWKRVVGKEVMFMSPILKANLPGILISLAGLIIEVIFNSGDE